MHGLVALSPRAATGVWLSGLLGATVLTLALRSAPEAASSSFLIVCTIENVPAPRFPDALFTVAVEPIPLYLLVSVVAGYWLLRQRVAKAGRPRLIPLWRAWTFTGGAALIGLAVFGPLAGYSQTFLFVHMMQHFMLVTIAPPLLLLGAPLTLLLVAAGPQTRQRNLYPLLRSRAMHALTNPAIGVFLFVAVPLVWYTTPLFELSLENVWLHYLGFGLFLLAGVHYWWPVAGGNPSSWHLPHPVRIFYLFALVPIHAFLGSLFYEPSRVMFPVLGETPRYWGPSPLLDQQIAGAMMFIVGEMIGLIATLMAAFAWANADDRAARAYDRRAALKGSSHGE